MRRILLYILLYILLPLQPAQATLPADYVAPQPASLYDWRNTHWFGGTGGTVSGTGLSYNYWGERHGWRFTLLPLIGDSDYQLLVAGAARLFSLNTPPPCSAGPLGFTNRHYYWFLSSAHGFESRTDYEDKDRGTDYGYLGTLSGGFGVDLNRRASRFSFLLGFGPYLNLGDNTVLNFYPTFEFAWHFGAPHRISP